MPMGGASMASPEYQALMQQYLKTQKGVVDVNSSAKQVDYSSSNTFSNKKSKKVVMPESTLSSVESSYADIETDHDYIVSNQGAVSSNQLALRQVGYHLFGHKATVFYASTAVPSEYQLTVGDAMTLFIYGKKEQVVELVVDVEGDIFFPSIGPIKIVGLTQSQAIKKIRQKLSTHYVNFDFKIVLNSVTRVNVNIVGDVNQPGVYSINKFESMLVLLSEAGGVQKTGTLRNIKVVRQGKVVDVVDLYDYLYKDKGGGNVTFQSSDTIVVSKIGATVGLQGAIKSPGIYELKSGESLQALIQYASGFELNAYKNALYINRLDDYFRRKVDVVYSASKKELQRKLAKTQLKDGDLVFFKTRTHQKYGYIKLNGHVNVPGHYAYRKGISLGELFDQAQGLQLNVHDTVQVYRYLNEDERTLISVSTTQSDFKLADRDIVRVFNQREVEEVLKVEVSGQVVHPGKYEYLTDMTLSDLMLLAKPKVFSSLGNIELTRFSDKDSIVYYLNITSDADYKIQPGDNLVVKLDSLRDQTVRITLTGEVRFPGQYRVKKGTRLDVVIARAGGFIPSGYLLGAVFTRNNVKLYDKLGQSKVIEDEKKRFVYDQSHLGNLSMDEKVSMGVMMQARKEALAFLQSKLKLSSGRVILDLHQDRFKDTKDNFIVQDGDVLFIPTAPESIHLIGGVQQGISIAYSPYLKVNDYVNNVGGYTKYADRNNVYVFKASGRVFRNASKIDPGDIIYVPEKVLISFNWLKLLTNITSIISNAVTSLALVKSIQ
jgi:protein involved in polysaccharide export with SLBB domain